MLVILYVDCLETFGMNRVMTALLIGLGSLSLLGAALLITPSVHADGWVPIDTPPISATYGVVNPSDKAGPRQQDEALKAYPKGALLKTSRGDMVLELFEKEAPLTTRNFQQLVDKGFYNGLVFHRVVPGFVVQTGDPTGTGSGGSAKTIKLEVDQKLSHTARGIVAMARKQEPNSASSQFYITLAPAPSLNGKYAVFGRVISGLDVLDEIKQGDTVNELTLIPLQGQARSKAVPPRDTFGYRIKNLILPNKNRPSAKAGLVKP